MSQQDCSTILQPLSVSQLTSLANLASINYTNQDFYSLKTRLVSFIQQNFPTDFADFVESDLGIMLIENWAFIADMLSFKMDQIVNELFIDTVTELANAFRLCELVGYQPTPPIASTALFSATIQSPLVTDLVINSGVGLDISTGGQVITFELFAADANNNPIFNEDIVITSGQITNTSIIGIQGNTITESFSGDGTMNQSLTLSNFPVLFDSVMVQVDGTQWTQVPYFTDSQPRTEYLVQYSSTWQAFVIFGNGTAGRVPTQGSGIQVVYRTGGGPIGNIISNFIAQSRGFEVPGFNFSVPVTFTNYTAGNYGYSGDTIDVIRNNLPRYIASQNRAVTGADYKNLAELYSSPYNGQVGKALAVLRNVGCAGNIVDLYVLATAGTNGLQTANDQLKAELVTYFAGVQMLTDFLCIRDGVVLSVDVILDVTCQQFFQKFQQQIQQQIINTVNNFFLLSNWDYGQSLKNTALMQALASISQISDLQVSFVTNDPNNSGNIVVAQYYEVIRNDNITINLMFQ